MKTLYERLSDDNKVKIEAKLLIFPYVTQNLIDVLKIEVGIFQLQLYQANYLYDIVYPTAIFDLDKFVKIFE